MKRSGSILAYVVALTLLCASAYGRGRSSLTEVGRRSDEPLLSAPVFSPAGQLRPFGKSLGERRVVQPRDDRATAPLVTKYQRSPAGVHVGRTPVFDRGWRARLNRFVSHRASSAPPSAATSVVAIKRARAGER